MPEQPPLVALADAAIYVEDLARGVQGEFIISEEDCGDSERALREIHDCQLVLYEAGWRRCPSTEWFYAREFSHNVEVAIYRRQFPGHRKPFFIQINLTTRFGVRAVFIGKR